MRTIILEEQLEVDVSYDGLNRTFNSDPNALLDYGDYQVFILPTNKSFIGFLKMESKEGECPEGKIFKKYGLKFHISLPEYNMPMYKKGWEIVRNTLIEYEVESFKIARSNIKMSKTLGQEGKDLTVYADAEPSRTLQQWQKLLQTVTQNLVDNNILPGYRPPGTGEKPEKPVNGSNYITYRYYDETKKRSIWPKRDPCELIKVTTDCKQPDIPILVKELRGEEKKDELEQGKKFI